MKQDELSCKYSRCQTIKTNRIAFILLLLFFTGMQLFSSAQTKMNKMKTQSIVNNPDDEAAIRALEDKFAAALNAGDIDVMMNNYIQDESLVFFDVVPRKEYCGADAYRKDWVDFFSHFNGTPKFSITDLGITVDGNLGFSHSMQHVKGTDIHGHSVDRTVRVTDGYRKIDGKWLIVLEHVSMPVDLATGKIAPTLKP